jgi:hypothetical protein
MLYQRRISRIYNVPELAPGFVGPGHLAAPVIPPEDFAINDPFILLMDDHLDIGDRPVGGAHPHAGFETVTLLLQGSIYDRDEGGSIEAGEVQWMTAGRGIIHGENVGAKGKVRLLQLWLTLPKADRWTEPGFQTIHTDAVPSPARERGRGPDLQRRIRFTSFHNAESCAGYHHGNHLGTARFDRSGDPEFLQWICVYASRLDPGGRRQYIPQNRADWMARPPAGRRGQFVACDCRRRRCTARPLCRTAAGRSNCVVRAVHRRFEEGHRPALYGIPKRTIRQFERTPEGRRLMCLHSFLPVMQRPAQAVTGPQNVTFDVHVNRF